MTPPQKRWYASYPFFCKRQALEQRAGLWVRVPQGGRACFGDDDIDVGSPRNDVPVADGAQERTVGEVIFEIVVLQEISGVAVADGAQERTVGEVIFEIVVLQEISGVGENIEEDVGALRVYAIVCDATLADQSRFCPGSHPLLVLLLLWVLVVGRAAFGTSARKPMVLFGPAATGPNGCPAVGTSAR
eukprot:CAMPEP_0198609442 /NCGR_PEP_ID=MMETSP1462-20131121/156395_1 /TAXON_ID=1333877 /ORGANISM="Brandtodinium nutriculum, Strain RCC3387" /LENGTH=187 /DNA_ID=CAMNT_0044341247 /DNA_START=452 /DNA_END=1014 /DNA_ORIENTATION=+